MKTEDKFLKLGSFLDSSLKPIAEKYHKPYFDQFIKFRKKNGWHCPFVQAALKAIYIAEIARKGEDFITRFNKNDWTNYN